MLADGQAQRKGTGLMAHFRYRVAAGSVITLRSTSLGGQQRNAIWRLREAQDMQQQAAARRSPRTAAVQLNAAHTRYPFSPTITIVAAPATIRNGIRIA
ncbi:MULTISPECIES: hypothetical protein [Burkholderia]|uniref:hypothetical protein n=1 Tax=Burkholderia TaxID=32008 RepID=UPI0004FFC4A4|nr:MULTISPECIES: hypothetical protein [Burkholderia]KFL53623.1 hypothetical protein JM78_08795 [Burkholderia pyrrocinia]